MKAIIKLDAPEWQIGQDVSVYFPDTMLKHGKCELLKEQKAKTGYWIDSAGYDKCSICGAEYSDLYPDYSNTHFCPNCGAKMESGEVK